MKTRVWMPASGQEVQNTCNSSSKGPDALFWPSRACMRAHIHTHQQPLLARSGVTGRHFAWACLVFAFSTAILSDRSHVAEAVHELSTTQWRLALNSRLPCLQLLSTGTHYQTLCLYFPVCLSLQETELVVCPVYCSTQQVEFAYRRGPINVPVCPGTGFSHTLCTTYEAPMDAGEVHTQG